MSCALAHQPLDRHRGQARRYECDPHRGITRADEPDQQDVENRERPGLPAPRNKNEHAEHARGVEEADDDERALGHRQKETADDQRGHQHMGSADQLQRPIRDRGAVMGPLVDQLIELRARIAPGQKSPALVHQLRPAQDSSGASSHSRLGSLESSPSMNA